MKSDLLRSLHHGPKTLLLPNAWDVASARIFERAGFPALGTTSAGIAFALGYPDGQHISRDEMIQVVERIARAVSVPVTADVEAGYDDPVATAEAVWAAGAVGMNLEDVRDDQLVPLDAQIAALRAIRAATPNMVINARNDIFLNAIGDESTRFERSVERLRAYRDAGADCLFAPGVRDRETIAKLVRALNAPLNILASAGLPPISELESLGVARVSLGSGPKRATLGLIERIARELHDRGTYSSMLEGAIPYADVNRIFDGS